MKNNKKGKSHGKAVKTFVRRQAVSKKARSHSPAPEKHATGVFSSTRSGFGFVKVEGRERDVYIPEGLCRDALDGDTVEIAFRVSHRAGEEHTEGRVLRIEKAAHPTVIGTLVPTDGLYRATGGGRAPRYTVLPDDTKLSVAPLVADEGGAQVGDKVEVKIRREGGRVTGQVVRVFGRADTKEANYEAILARAGIETAFSENVLAEAEKVAKQPLTADGRRDLSERIIFTIDGAGAKDLDDAISLDLLPGGKFLLGVHIADVSHYVAPGSALDACAMARGTSVYFTDKVVPMLPPALSNGACSLNAGEKKYALTAEMTIDGAGTILATEIYESVIESRVRGVYSEVNDLFEKGENSDYAAKYREILPTLTEMRRLYLLLKRKSEARGALELDSAEAVIELDGAGDPVNVVPVVRGDGEKMIEQFMLAANEGVATLLKSKNIPCVYRVHADPAPEKRDAFLLFLHNLGIDRENPSGEVTPKVLGTLLSAAKERGIGLPVSYLLLRTLAKAVYSEKPSGHFGLAIPTYCHFTSPIRRLSDLATHRVIKRVLLGGASPALYRDFVKEAARAASETEVRAMEAERGIEDLYKAIYMSKHIGEVFSATVSGVASFGFFAMAENTCEGLVPLCDLPGVFRFDEAACALRSRDLTFRLGDPVTVRVADVDLVRGNIRYSYSAAI